MVRRSNVVVATAYGGPDAECVRNLALAVAWGKPLVRWWVGTDVLACSEREDARRGARLLDRVVSRNVAVASHLVRELDAIGISAVFIPSLVAISLARPLRAACDVPRALLVYLPTTRKEFYGVEIVRRAVVANPDLKFVVVADESHCLAEYPHVVSLGWVDDMRKVWPMVGGLLRITRHDGMPRMVLEGLLQGKYVIYSWPFPGCWEANTSDAVQRELARFRAVSGPNAVGVEAATALLTPDPAQRFARMLEDVRTESNVHRRLAALALLMSSFAQSKGMHPPAPGKAINRSPVSEN